MVAVGFNPRWRDFRRPTVAERRLRAKRKQADPTALNMMNCVCGIEFKRRAATLDGGDVGFFRGLKPTATITGSLRDRDCWARPFG